MYCQVETFQGLCNLFIIHSCRTPAEFRRKEKAMQ